MNKYRFTRSIKELACTCPGVTWGIGDKMGVRDQRMNEAGGCKVVEITAEGDVVFEIILDNQELQPYNPQTVSKVPE